jgi:hypothetical protein
MKSIQHFATLRQLSAALLFACATPLAAVATAGVVAPEAPLPTTQPEPALPPPPKRAAAKAATPITPPAVAKATASVDDIVKTNGADKPKKQTLRCWQNGQLIVERPVSTPPPESAKAVSIDSDVASGMRLFDLRNAMCLVQ